MKERRTTEVLPSDAALREQLVRAIAVALPAATVLEDASSRASTAYRAVAVVLVDLRHCFKTSDGVSPDLKGRSYGYRTLVRSAYVEAGAAGDGPIEKRLTAGVSYWVRKLLVERYGKEKLREYGVLPDETVNAIHNRATSAPSFTDPHECLLQLVELLNLLAADPDFRPGMTVLNSAARAIQLMATRSVHTAA